MSDDKRPKPLIDMTANHASPPPRLEIPGRDANPASSAPKNGNKAPPQPRPARRGGFFSHLFAALVGGAIVAGGVYAVLTEDIPGLSLADPATRRDIRELRAHIQDLDRAARLQSANTGTTGPQIESNEARSRLDGLVTATHALEQTAQEFSQRLLAVEQKGGGISGASLQGEIANQIAPLTQRLAGVERDIDAIKGLQNERQADARSAALTLALTNLKRAISDGRPFSAELAAVENLSSVRLPVAALQPYKDAGVPSNGDLIREFQDASKKAIEKHYQSRANSLVGEVLSRAKAAIQVRPSDSTGDTVEAILGRMDSALRSGNLRGAVTEGATLDGAAQQEMQSWLGQAQARLAADEALRKTDQELLAALTKVTTRRQ